MSSTKYSSKAEQLKNVLEELVHEANVESQFSHRKTALRAEHFVQILVLRWLKKGDASLNDLAQSAQEMGYEVTGSAINERIGVEAVSLLGRILVKALRQNYVYPHIPVKALNKFSAIHVTDSTQVSIPMSLQGEFAGNTGNAMLKLQVTFDYLTGQWVGLEIEPGKTPDNLSDLPVRHAIAGSLNLFDLGYFKQERLRDIMEQEAYFVSRYQSQTALYDVMSGERIDLVSYLQALCGNERELAVQVGRRLRLPMRLLMRRLSQKDADARRRKAKKKYREQGKTCSKSYLFLLGWDMLLSNLSLQEWTLTQIFNLYPIRIQIEWLFRIWKSLGQLDYFGNWRCERVLCQLYAHLIGFLLAHRLSAGWLLRGDCEYGPFQCVQVIRNKIPNLMKCVKHDWWGLKTWIQKLELAFGKFARKTKRKKAPSTLQSLREWGLS